MQAIAAGGCWDSQKLRFCLPLLQALDVIMKRPTPILLAIIHHTLAAIYSLLHVGSIFPLTAHAAGGLTVLILVSFALILFFFRPNAGRWLSVAIFAIGTLSLSLAVLVALSRGAPFLKASPLIAIVVFFATTAYLLAFGESTKKYISGLTNHANI